MKDTRFDKAVEGIRKIRMTTDEKDALRKRIFMAAGIPLESPWSLYSFSSWIMRHRAVSSVSVAVLIVVLAGGGVASAAQGALPGDVLYPVKVDVTEPLQVALAPTPEAKAAVQAQLTDTRLEEAETLAAQGRLSTSSQQQIVGLISQHTAALDASLAQVSQASPQQAADISMDFQASMDAHAAVLQTIASSTVSDPIIAAAQASAQSVAGRQGQQGDTSGQHEDGRASRGGPGASGQVQGFHGKLLSGLVAVGTSTSSTHSISSASSTPTASMPAPAASPADASVSGLTASTTPAAATMLFRHHRDMVESLIQTASTSAEDLDAGTDTTPLERAIVNGTHRALGQAEQTLQQADQQDNDGDQGDADASLLDSQTSATEAGIFSDIGAKFGWRSSGGQDGGHH